MNLEKKFDEYLEYSEVVKESLIPGYKADWKVPESSGPEWVEIAGIKWAKWNVGATSETQHGLFFAWGETQGYNTSQVGTNKNFSWADYELANGDSSDITKYNTTDELTTLQPDDDAAQVSYGGNWRMPNDSEYQALGGAVNTEWTSDYQGSGIAGIICTDKTDSSKVLFFPADGYCNDGNINNVNSYGYYWSSSLDSSDTSVYGRSLAFSDGNVSWSGENYRKGGFSVRAVLAD